MALLNLNLPARVYLPLCDTNPDGGAGVLSLAGQSPRPQEHHVVRFPPQEAALLNSRDRVPYLVYVEVLYCENSQTAPLPEKLALASKSPDDAPSTSGEDERTSRVMGGVSGGDGGASTPVRRDSDGASSRSRNPSEVETDGGATPTADAAANPFSSELRDESPTEAAADSGEALKQGYVSVSDIRRNLVRVLRAPSFGDSKDMSAVAFKEPWLHKVERIRRSSPYGHLPNWHLVPVIIKSGDDLRQELLGSQLMSAFRGAWAAEKVALWIRPLQILVASHDGGLIEVVGSAVSIHQIKQTSETLMDYFLAEFGPATSERFLAAQRNFAQSLAGYSLFCYFAQVKDRHNRFVPRVIAGWGSATAALSPLNS